MWLVVVFFFKQKTAYEMRISDWSSDVCSSDLIAAIGWKGDDITRFRLPAPTASETERAILRHLPGATRAEIGRASCREKSVSVRVDLGGRRIIKKKTTISNQRC